MGEDRPLPRTNQEYKVMEDISPKVESAISTTCSILSVTRSQAIVLLRQFSWDTDTVTQRWFDDEERIRNKLGFVETPNVQDKPTLNLKDKLRCGICLEEHYEEKMKKVDCGHTFCDECWSTYVTTSLNNDGERCLTLRCPDDKCTAFVGQEFIYSLENLPEQDRQRYAKYIPASFVEHNKHVKWCPGPGCEYAVEVGSSAMFKHKNKCFDVSCKCCHRFCWNCSEESHSPVDCKTVEKWKAKNTDESEGANWILVNSKPCPGCKRPIEKNQGCMHMTCSICLFEFCWLCLLPWSEHNGRNYECNSYQTRLGSTDEEEQGRVEDARSSLGKYLHYYERWAGNEDSKRRGIQDMVKMMDVHIVTLKERFGYGVPQEMDFVVDGWKQIVECRSILKWTYSYGYYIPDEEVAKTNLFECLQGQAESALERLHHCAERELAKFIVEEDGKCSSSLREFVEFRDKLSLLTKVARRYFGNLVAALEDNLRDVVGHKA